MMDLALVRTRLLGGIMVVGWYVMRYPFERESPPAAHQRKPPGAWRALAAGDFAHRSRLVPAIHVATGWPIFADYPAHPLAVGLGIAAAIGALVMFRLTHKALGAMWSVLASNSSRTTSW